jgi:hypothetical protein
VSKGPREVIFLAAWENPIPTAVRRTIEAGEQAFAEQPRQAREGQTPAVARFRAAYFATGAKAAMDARKHRSTGKNQRTPGERRGRPINWVMEHWGVEQDQAVQRVAVGWL